MMAITRIARIPASPHPCWYVLRAKARILGRVVVGALIYNADAKAFAG
jgi:hypothetical protein